MSEPKNKLNKMITFFPSCQEFQSLHFRWHLVESYSTLFRRPKFYWNANETNQVVSFLNFLSLSLNSYFLRCWFNLLIYCLSGLYIPLSPGVGIRDVEAKKKKGLWKNVSTFFKVIHHFQVLIPPGWLQIWVHQKVKD